MSTFEQLVSSRKEWIDTVLSPWCLQAKRMDLMKAALEWTDIAGKVAPEATLWTWAWSRFPELVCEGLVGVNETLEVKVCLKDGKEYSGYPNNQKTEYGNLVLLQTGEEPYCDSPPLSIDDITKVTRIDGL